MSVKQPRYFYDAEAVASQRTTNATKSTELPYENSR